MKPTVEIYTAGPVSGTEAAALTQLVEMFSAAAEDAVIFSNFTCGKTKRQVDFFVATASHAAHLELKHFWGLLQFPCEIHGPDEAGVTWIHAQ